MLDRVLQLHVLPVRAAAADVLLEKQAEALLRLHGGYTAVTRRLHGRSAPEDGGISWLLQPVSWLLQPVSWLVQPGLCG